MSTPGSILAVRANIRYLTGFCTAMRVERIDNSEFNHSITVTRSCLLPLHEWVTSHKQFINSDILLPFVGFIIRALILNTLKLFIFKCWRTEAFRQTDWEDVAVETSPLLRDAVTSLSICSSIEFENKTCHHYEKNVCYIRNVYFIKYIPWLGRLLCPNWICVTNVTLTNWQQLLLWYYRRFSRQIYKNYMQLYL